jgi:hypothetical protein
VRCGAPRDPLVPTEWVCVPLGEWQRLLELER